MDDLSAILHLGSKHLGNEAGIEYNEQNPGLGVRFPIGNYYGGLGAYKNSLGKNSAYAGIGKEMLRFGPAALNLNGGLITGYEGGTHPFLLPELQVDLAKNAGLLFQYVPAIKHDGLKTDPTIGMALRIPTKGLLD